MIEIISRKSDSCKFCKESKRSKIKNVKIYVDPFNDRTLDVGDVFESTSFQSVFARE